MSDLKESLSFYGIPPSCEMVGYIHECMPGRGDAALERAVNELTERQEPPDEEFRRHFFNDFNVDSLSLIEMGMAVEDCRSCVHGIGSGACRLGEVIVKFDEDNK